MRMRIGTRILLGFGAVVALTIGLGWYGLAKQAEVRTRTTEMDNRDFRVQRDLTQVMHSVDQMKAFRERALAQHLFRKAHLHNGDPAGTQEEWRRSKDQAAKLLAELETAATEYERNALSPHRASQWRKIRLAAKEAQDGLKALAGEVEARFGLASRGELVQLVEQTAALDRLRQDFEARLTSVAGLTEEQIEIGRAEIAASYDQARTSTLAALAAAVLLGIGCGTLIQRSITRPLGEFVQFVGQVGQGDLTQQAAVSRSDEIGDLGQSLNEMVAGLKDVASQSRQAAENLSTATAEILASAQQQAASTGEQAAAVQQSTATMSEISQSGAQISERAKQVAAAAEATSTASAAGQQAVETTSRIMVTIREQAEAVAENVVTLSEKTQAIGEIISTATDIAEQSHLLALNAAIEAAAAGEHGRSFSVVASEIKNLADQSKEATVQVRSILGDIQKGINGSVMLTEEAVKRADSGKQQAEIADRTIRQLTDNIQQSIQAFQQIVAGTNQQQIGFEQVTLAVKNIGQASDQTAASTRQLEKAAANVNALTQQLRKAVERYRI